MSLLTINITMKDGSYVFDGDCNAQGDVNVKAGTAQIIWNALNFDFNVFAPPLDQAFSSFDMSPMSAILTDINPGTAKTTHEYGFSGTSREDGTFLKFEDPKVINQAGPPPLESKSVTPKKATSSVPAYGKAKRR